MKRFLPSSKQLALILSFFVLAQIVLPAFSSGVRAADSGTPEIQLAAKSAVLMDAESGQVLFEMNADEALPPASMSKMMTEYIVLENIKNGKYKWEDTVTASKYASEVIGSGGLIGNGEKLSVKQMFSAMSIYSANDASVALAEFTAGGSEEKFAELMNETAKKLGLSDKAHFINATGLTRADIGPNAPKNIQGETVMSARDTAILASRLLKDHPEVLDFTKIPAQKLRDKDPKPMINYNWMLDGNKDNINFKKYAYPGLDGLKTGHTNEAGYCFTATAMRNGIRIISVVMGTATEPKRFEESRKVLDYGFNNFEKKTIVQPNTTVDSLKTVEVKKAVNTTVPVVTEKDLTLIVKKGVKDDQFVRTAQSVDQSKLVAPLKKGTVVGTLKVTYNNKENLINLVTAEDAEKAGWFKLMMRSIGEFFSNIGKSVKKLFKG